MSDELPHPIRRALDADPDEASIRRVWSSVRARRDARAPSAMPWRTLAVAAVLVSAVGAVALWPSDPEPVITSGPLRLADGSEPAAFEGTSALSDGSSITVDGRLSTLESSDGAFVLLLSEGSAHFEVTPGGPRRWTIECGLVTVEVVGTIFSITRDKDPEVVIVEVERGAVLVRGDLVEDRVQRLGPGDRLEVRAPVEHMATVETPPDDAPAEPEAPVAAARPDWRELADRNQYREAYESLGDEGFRREVERAGVNELFALADVARLGGHPNDAIPPLERIVAEYSTNSRASLAAFTLGRIHLDNRGDAPRAIELFDRALALGLTPDLAQAALARLAQARARTGDAAGASAAARQYLERYPSGPHRAALEPLVAGDAP